MYIYMSYYYGILFRLFITILKRTSLGIEHI